MSQTTAVLTEEPCLSCALMLDVTEESLFGLVRCPLCLSEVRVRARVGNYQILDVLGHGGSGRVFRVRLYGDGGGDENRDEFALKVLEKNHLDYDEHLLFLKNEAFFAPQVEHPRVVKVVGFEEDDEGARLLMEIMEGGSLHDLIGSGARLGEARILETGLEILKALSATYAKGVVHGDLKPANILFTSSGSAKLGDFGLARSLTMDVSTETHLMATPDYIAPEILAGELGNPQSDVYGLGGTLYHALTERTPYQTEGCSMEELASLKKTPVNLASAPGSIHPKTAELINRMMNPDPKARFSSYDELEGKFHLALEYLDRRSKISKGRRMKRRGVFLARFFSRIFGGV